MYAIVYTRRGYSLYIFDEVRSTDVSVYRVRALMSINIELFHVQANEPAFFPSFMYARIVYDLSTFVRFLRET